jgi:hypothetical protein
MSAMEIADVMSAWVYRAGTRPENAEAFSSDKGEERSLRPGKGGVKDEKSQIRELDKRPICQQVWRRCIQYVLEA